MEIPVWGSQMANELTEDLAIIEEEVKMSEKRFVETEKNLGGKLLQQNLAGDPPAAVGPGAQERSGSHQPVAEEQRLPEHFSY